MLVSIKTGEIQHSISIKVAVDCIRITLSHTRTVFAVTDYINYQFIQIWCHFHTENFYLRDFTTKQTNYIP